MPERLGVYSAVIGMEESRTFVIGCYEYQQRNRGARTESSILVLAERSKWLTKNFASF